MELGKVFEAINEALRRKDTTIWCQQREIESLKKQIEKMEKGVIKDEVCN